MEVILDMSTVHQIQLILWLCLCSKTRNTHSLRGVDDACVVAKLERADHSRPHSQHQMGRHLLS